MKKEQKPKETPKPKPPFKSNYRVDLSELMRRPKWKDGR